MKTFFLYNDTWIEKSGLVMTEEEKLILNDTDTSIESRSTKIALLRNIQARAEKPATDEDIIVLQSIYDANKIPNSKLISATIVLPSGNGIINCRVGTKHHQIRF